MTTKTKHNSSSNGAHPVPPMTARTLRRAMGAGMAAKREEALARRDEEICARWAAECAEVGHTELACLMAQEYGVGVTTIYRVLRQAREREASAEASK